MREDETPGSKVQRYKARYTGGTGADDDDDEGAQRCLRRNVSGLLVDWDTHCTGHFISFLVVARKGVHLDSLNNLQVHCFKSSECGQ